MNKPFGYVLPVVSGILLALSFPLMDLSYLAWFALVPLMLSVRGSSAWEAFRKGFITGMVFFLASIYWVINTMYNYGGLNIYLSLLLLVALSAYLALYVGAFAWGLSIVGSRSQAALVAFAPAFWVSLELLRDYLISGFPWNLLGYSQHSWLTAIQVADVTGVYGVSALVVLANAALSYLLTLKGTRPSVGRLAAPVLALAVIAAAFYYGHYRLAHLPQQDGHLKVALIQGNIEQFHKWDPAFQDEVFDTYKKLTLQAAKDRPDLIAWPETATPFYFQDKIRGREMRELARASGTYIMTGSPTLEAQPPPSPPPQVGRERGSKTSDGDERYVEYNSAYLLSPGGETVGRYDKMHLVPFGEYVPLKRLLPFVSKMVSGIGDFGSGGDYTVLKAGKGSFGTAICFEAIFPEMVRHFALRGANFLTSITNDAWFGRSAAPYQHFNMAVMRAVENRRALVRIANTGITGIILPSGAVSARTGLFTTVSIEGEIPLVSELSFYTRHGDLFAYACAGISLVLLAAFAFRKRGSDG
jgi:apolipoprotein N-acyltransferase